MARATRVSVLLLLCATMAVSLGVVSTLSGQPATNSPPPTPAPAGFDGQTNGFLTQLDFDQAQDIFDEREEIDEGLGPIFNAAGCVDCHMSPVSGGISQVTELRAGRLVNGNFVDAPGGSLINDRAIHADIQETVPPGHTVRTFRTSLNTLGDGFVEAIDDDTLRRIAARQPASMRGEVIEVPVLEANGTPRVGRFGWKNQHASLQSFSADAYLNEMGITSPLQPTENSSLGRSVAAFDQVADPEDTGEDVEAFANFMRSTKAPPRDAALANTLVARAGEAVFNVIGCDNCHTPSIVTAPAGTPINGNTLVVPAALGNKVIRPFGDFLLHDIGTGDGIVQNGPPSTRNKVRTAPLWGVRTRPRLMHDGESLTFEDAILRHRGQAFGVRNNFLSLSNTQRQWLFAFLRSL